MKTHVLLIGGGNAFKTREAYLEYLRTRSVSLDNFRPCLNWKNSLQTHLGNGFDILMPQMPNNQNARYSEWKIWFERILALLTEEVILIGHSMGGIFLTRYLSEHTIAIRIRGLFLLASPFFYKDEYQLADFFLPKRLGRVMRQAAGQIFIYHSNDDKTVPVKCAWRYKDAFPNAHLYILENCGHLNQQAFPEIIQAIKSLPR